MSDFDDLIGIPFVNRGRSKMGADCWGAVRLVYEKFGITLPDFFISCYDTSGIGRQIDAQRFVWEKIKEPEAPCVVVFRGLDSNLPTVCSHVGAYVGDGYFFHSMSWRNLLRERLDHPFFKNKIEGFYRYVDAS